MNLNGAHLHLLLNHLPMIIFARRVQAGISGSSTMTGESQNTVDENLRRELNEHFTEQSLANENIFLAWIRTGLTLMSFGFVVNQFGYWLQEFVSTVSTRPTARPSVASVYLGIAMVVFGGLLCVLAAWRFYKVDGQIKRGEVRADRALVGFVTVLASALTIAMAVFMYLTSGQI